MTIEELYEALEAGIKDLEADYGDEVNDFTIFDLAQSIAIMADSPATARKFLRTI